ncbi:hypothetical protein LG634_30385 [Streptomyces bambusae]|uniref:hypothetical protein n=1 Tax=Streptomyces bambusae TaxID=1550616 RepID=UPI001CFF9E0F|nr:hypothetical protein [Streptomyces bambusae]MCB5169103.1 hypothetical protein [Streptomyces bambusae]
MSDVTTETMEAAGAAGGRHRGSSATAEDLAAPARGRHRRPAPPVSPAEEQAAA